MSPLAWFMMRWGMRACRVAAILVIAACTMRITASGAWFDLAHPHITPSMAEREAARALQDAAGDRCEVIWHPPPHERLTCEAH